MRPLGRIHACVFTAPPPLSQVFHLDMPTAAPVLYELDAALEPGPQRGTWGTSDVPRRGKFLLPEELIADAQRAMREQARATLQPPLN